ncbi:MAG: carbon-nitrogen hydrolase family protein [Thermoplasmata archaeon]|nr:carbon-nitrogen hydrolase family protein [Thermoplasmata archaeon]
MKAMAVSMEPKVGNKRKNMKKMIRFIEKEEADLYVFGELSLTGYICRDELFELAEDADGESISEMEEIAKQKDANIIFGMPVEEREGIIYNAAVMANPDGIGIYKKNYLANFGPFEEKFYFKEGSIAPVFKTKFATIGMCICYDIFFPELLKSMSLKGADIIVCISASPSTSRQFFEKVFSARAIENTSFLIYSNLAGEEENLVFWGGSQIYDPMGNLMARAEYFKEGYILQDLNLSLIKDARIARPTLRDTKADVFLDLYNIAREKQVFSEDVKIGIKIGREMPKDCNEIVVYGNDDVAFGIKLATGCKNVSIISSKEIKVIFKGKEIKEVMPENVKEI